MEQLNKLEREILELILDTHESYYKLLKLQVPYLYINSREQTGVGVFINFLLKMPDLSNLEIDRTLNTVLSVPKLLVVDTLVNPLSFELDIKDGVANFIEVVTNGAESWDGRYNDYKFIDW